MKKFIMRVLGFIGISITLYPLFIFTWGSAMPQMFKPNLFYRIGSSGHLFTRVQEIDKYKDIDVLIVGSSHAYRGFDARIFEENGISAFNLGSSGQTPINGKVLLKRYLEELDPQLVIYEVFPGSFNSDGVESSLDIIANDRNDLLSVKMALRVNNLKTYNTLIFGLFQDLFNRNKDFQEPIQKVDEKYISGGYVQREPSTYKVVDYDDNSWDFKEKQFKAFNENLEFIRSKGIKVILVVAPMTENINDAFNNSEAFDNRMKKYGDYYNFNGNIELIDSLHFYDAHHLNQEGVQLFNRKFLEVVPLVNE